MLGTATLFANGTAVADDFIPTVLVGDINNDPDSTGFGAVAYDYYISTSEITTTQYVAFLNAVAQTDNYGLWNERMLETSNAQYGCGITRYGTSGDYHYEVDSAFAARPVNHITFWDAARFCNWLTTGDTETGLYDFAALRAKGELNDDGSPKENAALVRDMDAWMEKGGVAIASENEWYKAAYYYPQHQLSEGVIINAGYVLYPTNSNFISDEDANYGADHYPNVIKDVNSYSTKSYYQTRDQGGNVSEWTESVANDNRIVRGGWAQSNEDDLSSSVSYEKNPDEGYNNVGFRIVSKSPIVVPEPSTYALFCGALLGGVIFRRRRNK